jgi:hypothetical protein
VLICCCIIPLISSREEIFLSYSPQFELQTQYLILQVTLFILTGLEIVCCLYFNLLLLKGEFVDVCLQELTILSETDYLLIFLCKVFLHEHVMLVQLV